MSFKRSNQEEVGSSRRRTSNKRVLARWLPQAVIDSDRSLNYVLLHGDDELDTGWNPSWLTQEAAAAFLEFLEDICPDQTGFDIFPTLRARVENGSPPSLV